MLDDALFLSVVLIGSTHGDLFGSSVAGIGDVDRDGLPDVATVVCEWGGHEEYPGVAAFSGLDGRLLWRGAVGVHPQRFCKRSLQPVGDVDQDGWDDLGLLGWRTCEGGTETRPLRELGISVISGRDGSTLRRIPIDLGLSTSGSAAFTSLGDVDGDSVFDLAVVAETNTRSGTWIQSCKTGEILRRLDPDPDWRSEAYWIESLGDLDGDGFRDVAVFAKARDGASRQASERPRTSVLIRSSNDGERILAIESVGNWTIHGCLGLGDVDGDGRSDLAIGGMAWIENPRKQGGGECRVEARIHSGSDGRILRTIHGLLADPKDMDMATPGDFDRDGRLDLLLGEIQLELVGHGGSVRLHSAIDGSLLSESAEPSRGIDVSEYFGYSVAAAGDVDADGVPDWVVGQCTPWGDMEARMVVVSGSNGRAIHVIDRRRLPRFSSPR